MEAAVVIITTRAMATVPLHCLFYWSFHCSSSMFLPCLLNCFCAVLLHCLFKWFFHCPSTLYFALFSSYFFLPVFFITLYSTVLLHCFSTVLHYFLLFFFTVDSTVPPSFFHCLFHCSSSLSIPLFPFIVYFKLKTLSVLLLLWYVFFFI